MKDSTRIKSDLFRTEITILSLLNPVTNDEQLLSVRCIKRCDISHRKSLFEKRITEFVEHCKSVETDRTLSTPRHYAYLKITEGCNWKCGYCAIPLIRGPHVSVPMEVLEEASKLAAQGVKELIIIAQDTSYYGIGPLRRTPRVADSQ